MGRAFIGPDRLKLPQGRAGRVAMFDSEQTALISDTSGFDRSRQLLSCENDRLDRHVHLPQ